MHELLLFGQVPLSRHEQVLKILAGYTAMQPKSVAEVHQIYKPTMQPQQSVHVGGTQNLQQKPVSQNIQNRELVYMQLVEASDDEQGDQSLSDNRINAMGSSWSLQYTELPDAAKRNVTMRMATSVDLTEGDPYGYMNGLGYNFVSSYFLDGHRFVSNNIVILLHRILRFPSSQEGRGSLKEAMNSRDAMMPVDVSGGYILQASIKLQDRNKPDLLTRGVAELEDFKRKMKGVVNLREPDRLSLDTRVK